MKQVSLIIFVLCIALVSGINLEAQESATKAPTKYSPMVGLYVQQRGSVNVSDIPEGSKTSAAFSDYMDIGFQAMVPFSSDNNTTGFRLDIGWANYNLGSRSVTGTVDGPLSITTIGYYNISPSIMLGGFALGIDYGVPTSISSNGQATATEDLETKLKDYKPLLAARIGGGIPMLTTSQGRLNFELHASYCFNTVNTDEKYPSNSDPKLDRSKYNPRLVNLSFGVSYLVNLSSIF